MSHEGFLGTAARWSVDLTLLLELGMGIGLLFGSLLARMRRFRLHALCQSAIVLLNLVLIVLTMVPSFRLEVSPRLPNKLSKSYYGIAAVHAALGSVAEVAGLYLLLAAGTNLFPKKLRLIRYKFWMRSVLVLWWVVLLLGITTYARWYPPQLLYR
ncbi:MAG TPA: hypothetical protein VG051_06785 [Candidatus Acidoferrum sp.]|nr:hypothetical protein [Candidatus Acidoferrum sp.]